MQENYPRCIVGKASDEQYFIPDLSSSDAKIISFATGSNILLNRQRNPNTLPGYLDLTVRT